MAANDSKDVGDEKSTTTANPSETKFFTRLEVAKHTSSKDSWIIIHNSVYNVTSFLNEVTTFFHYCYRDESVLINTQV